MTKILAAKPVTEALVKEMQASAITVTAQLGRKPKLVVVVAGDDPASAIYIRNKQRRAEAVGIDAATEHLPASVHTSDVLAVVQRLNADDGVDGLIVQLPLPDGVDAEAVRNAVDPDKDVDGFTDVNQGRLWSTPKGQPITTLRPCTPRGIMKLLDFYNVPLAGKRAVILGRSNIVGKPMAAMLLHADATVTIAHSRTTNPQTILSDADIIVAATGQAGIVSDADVKPGAVIVDVGMNRIAGADGKSKLVGDVDFDGVQYLASAITPVPGGVGPMTVNMLIYQTIEAAQKRAAAK
ncbi:bifunctional 5,10-methylenetetrahydrofolate dehydrogenase/5,10-methenyltetrahydrofolate cyclohydrolase [Lacticaseibacillus pantheris]|jgi:methylenetetrahydrofolate dehydrogenase (NADP+)/methenyltetrahydrofolate cyclohydrolase|uniref:bifunctional 5,10-methylenetetrahydrofolate dehydrogenase/5,10-methenyltetrahydrofolate cyclohydrolase n=1 Tax=Lacticaseibacillus pantheris TaxID=171523 RepID=UPI002659F9DE|nr:bifunctional 5,10-methylenetetrahydrofolate dehydrogenase/5,10-methenyltetrahydrofolate cyclohydrolase [Lacticaseibacillus pantheris]WKF84424.1 bifunctional 5,10-methylenetetrahydrofolate dehydrogenase/5,10-methenyltetrahydrofolate cyclohydrolase [Lacticaseibacillus pantheris]